MNTDESAKELLEPELGLDEPKRRTTLKTKIAKELLAIHRALVAGEELLAHNYSSWSWEDDADNVTADIFVDATGELRLEVIRTHTKYGLGAGQRQVTLFDGSVGTLSSPKLGLIRGILKKNGHERTRAGAPFRRLWQCIASKQDMDLATILADKLASLGGNNTLKQLNKEEEEPDDRAALLRFISKGSDKDIQWMANLLRQHMP